MKIKLIAQALEHLYFLTALSIKYGAKLAIILILSEYFLSMVKVNQLLVKIFIPKFKLNTKIKLVSNIINIFEIKLHLKMKLRFIKIRLSFFFFVFD